MKKVNIREWRNLENQIYEDYLICSLYGAYQLLLISIIKDKTDFDIAIDCGLFEKDPLLNYQNFNLFSNYYRNITFPLVDFRIYNFIQTLNFEFYLKPKISSLPSEDLVLFYSIYYDSSNNSMELVDVKNVIFYTKIIKDCISETDKYNCFNMREMIYINKSEDMKKIRNNETLNFTNFEDILLFQYFQASLIFSERYINNSIINIKKIDTIIKFSGNKKVIECVEKVKNNLMGIFQTFYENIDILNSDYTNKKYKDLDIPTLYKLKNADFFINPQESLIRKIDKPIEIHNYTIKVFLET
jgi:hypothetical protein